MVGVAIVWILSDCVFVLACWGLGFRDGRLWIGVSKVGGAIKVTSEEILTNHNVRFFGRFSEDVCAIIVSVEDFYVGIC